MPDPRTICTVKANGRIYTSWKTISINHEFSNTVPTFQMTCSEGGPLGGANDSRRLVPQTPVTIELGDQLVLTGAIEARLASFEPTGHDVIIGGRSATAVPTFSAMPVQPGNFDGYTLEQAARGALQPHGTDLNVVNPSAIFSKPFAYLATNPGETVSSFIERMCRMRGVYMWGDAQGRLCVGQGNPGAAVVADLQESRNILRATVKLDDQGIFSAINVYGQSPAVSDDMSNRTAQATATDPSAKTTRIRVEHAEHPGDSEDMTARANLESARSSWDRVEVSVTVAGWFRPDGKLWGLTDNISFYSPMGLPNGTGKMTLGVQSVTYAQDAENGTTTTLTLVKPELLTSVPNAGVKTDGKGAYLDSPSAATPVAPDYQGPAGTGNQ